MRSNSWADALEPAFVGLTEGIWVAVLYLLFEIVGQTPITLSPVLFVAVAALAAVAGTRLGRFGSARWQVIAAVAVVVGVIGMLLGPGVLATLLAADPIDAFGAHPGGWLLGLAAFRGLIGVGALDDPDRVGRPFVRGVIALTLFWLYAGLLPPASLATFRAAALDPTLVFATVGIAAVGVRRVHAIALPAGIEWWRNRAWLAALLVLIVVLAILAVPVANGLTRTVPSILGLAGFPEVILLGLFVIWLAIPRDSPRPPRRAPLRSLLGLALLLVVAAVAYRIFHGTANQTTAPTQGVPAEVTTTTTNDLFGVVVLVAALLGIGLLAIVLARNWRSPAPILAADLAGDRSGLEFEGPGLGWLRRARRRWFGERSRGRPDSAETAYLATLDLLEPLHGLRRLPFETPQAHARRVRLEGGGTLELDLLAADFELARWGARQLPIRETRRALGRWERSKGRIAELILAEEATERHAAQRKGSDRD